MYTFTVALPEDMVANTDDGMLRITFEKPDSLFQVADQFKGLESALLAGLGYGGELDE